MALCVATSNVTGIKRQRAFFFGVLLIALNAASAASTYPARVVHVADGDSLSVRDAHGLRHKIRLAYIDAPELHQAGGQASRRYLNTLLDGQTVSVTVFGRDHYHRELACITFNGEDINLHQITSGMAWHYRSIARREQNKTDFAHYAAAQARAEHARRGLWSGKLPIPPWTWRRDHPQPRRMP